MKRLAVLGGAMALVLALGGCATTSASTVRIPDTAAAGTSASATPTLAGPVPQDPNPHGVTVARLDNASAPGALREGGPIPEPAQPAGRDPTLAGPTPQVPIPVTGRTDGPVPQDPNPHGVIGRPAVLTAAAGGEGTPTPEPASRHGHGHGAGPIPPVVDSPDVRVAGPVPQDPNPTGGFFGGREPSAASRDVAARPEPAPREPRPVASSREPMPSRGRAF